MNADVCRWFLGVTFFLFNSHLHALEFEVQDIAISPEQKIAFIPFVSDFSSAPELLVVETPDLDEREKQLQGLQQEPVRSIAIFRRSGSIWHLRLRKELDAAMDLIDTLSGRDGIGLVGYQNAQVMYLNDESMSFEPLLRTNSMFVGRNWDSSPTMEMFVDLNDDGFDDFLMPGFDGWQVAVQSVDGFTRPQVVGPRPHMNFGETAQYVGYRAETPYLLDENRDGLKDLAFWIDGRFQVHRQDQHGNFSTDKLILDANLRDVLGGYFSVSLGEGADNEGSSQRMLDGVQDINGDGLTDLIIQKIEGEGLFGLETEYEIYRGVAGSDNRLRFEPDASSVVSTGGIQLSNERLDLTGDGSQEFVVTSVNINIATIIGALITRSASVDVSIFRMIDSTFEAKPALKKEITVRFDFGTGELFVPAVLSADVTGDGQKDLLVQKGLDTLLVYPGQSGAKLFARTPIKLEMDLPQSRDGFVVSDLNRDGRDELILHVEREESSALSVIEFSD